MVGRLKKLVSDFIMAIIGFYVGLAVLTVLINKLAENISVIAVVLAFTVPAAVIIGRLLYYRMTRW